MYVPDSNPENNSINSTLSLLRFHAEGKHIYMIGFACSGKTTLGRQIAFELGIPFLDLDHWLEEQSGQKIREYIRSSGWEAFRQLESQLLLQSDKQFSQHHPDLPNAVIACGGGVILKEENRQFLMNPAFYRIWIDPPMDTIFARLSQEPRTPFENMSTSAIEAEFRFRMPLYESLADLRVEG